MKMLAKLVGVFKKKGVEEPKWSKVRCKDNGRTYIGIMDTRNLKATMINPRTQDIFTFDNKVLVYYGREYKVISCSYTKEDDGVRNLILKRVTS